MNFFDILLLSVIEGLTEFLPISSTGHLILASRILNLEPSNFLKTFEIVIQFGAILAVVTLYLKKFLSIKMLKTLFVAFIPTGIVGLVFYPLIKNFLLESPTVTLHSLFWGGVALIIIELLLKKSQAASSNVQTNNTKEPNYKQALIIGTFQSLSIIPGVSRAAATIVGGLISGLNRPLATEFSFLLAVPTMIAATTLDLYKSKDFITQEGYLTLFVGSVLSFIFAMFAIKFFISFVKKHTFIFFGVYRIILAILFWIFVI